MKLLIFTMGAYTHSDFISALQKAGISQKTVYYALNNRLQDEFFEFRMKQYMTADSYDAVFSFNFHPLLARLCMEHQIKYLSWSYDSPIHPAGLEDALGYETNYVFLFDRIEAAFYQKKGYSTVYHLPLAVNAKQLTETNNRSTYTSDVSFVGQLYNTEVPTLLKPLTPYLKGYVDGVLKAQQNLNGCTLLHELISDHITASINEAYQALQLPNFNPFNREFLINTLATHLTHLDRTLLLDVLSQSMQTKLYSNVPSVKLGNVQYCGSANYFTEMPYIFKNSKINLNPILRMISSGIPLRALDILSSGGFLLSSYQPELAEYFMQEEEMVMYTSLEDAIEKAAFYLVHEELRSEIARNGLEKVSECFSYQKQLTTLFAIAGLSL